MNLLELILLGLGLSMDCFAVALCFGSSRKLAWRNVLIMAFSFGIFQGLMPLIGYFIGSFMASQIASVDHWLAFGILSFIGIKMIWQAFRIDTSQAGVDITRWNVLFGLSLATSIDALITGVSFGFINVNIFRAVAIITAVTFLVTVFGAKIGGRNNFIPAKYAEILGGVVLILIGTRILMVHLGVV
jgi:manganese efflux pump family protein